MADDKANGKATAEGDKGKGKATADEKGKGKATAKTKGKRKAVALDEDYVDRLATQMEEVRFSEEEIGLTSGTGGSSPEVQATWNWKEAENQDSVRQTPDTVGLETATPCRGDDQEVEDTKAEDQSSKKAGRKKSTTAKITCKFLGGLKRRKRDKYEYCPEHSVMYVEALDEKKCTVNNYSVKSGLIWMANKSDCCNSSDEYDVSMGLSGTNGVMEKEPEASGIGFEAFGSPEQGHPKLKLHGESKNHIGHYDSTALGSLVQKSHELKDDCNKRTDECKEHNDVETLILIRKRRTQLKEACEIMKLVSRCLDELEDEISILQVDLFVLMKEKAEAILKFVQLKSELETLKNSDGSQRNQLLTDKIRAQNKDEKAVFESPKKELITSQVQNELEDSVKSLEELRMSNGFALKDKSMETGKWLKRLKNCLPVIVIAGCFIAVTLFCSAEKT